MAFTGQSTNTLFTPNLLGEDVSELIQTLTPYEAPILDWLGDGDTFATNTKHEFVEDYMRPRSFITSAAVNSATTTLAPSVDGGALTVGTILEYATTPEYMQVTSVTATSVEVTRNYGGAGLTANSLAPGATIRVKAPAALEGREHTGVNVTRLGNRRANTVGYFAIEIAESGTAMASNVLGADSFMRTRAKRLSELPALLEQEILTGRINTSQSLGSSTETRTMDGLRKQLTNIASTVANSAFTNDPHTYIGDVMQQVFNAGGSTTEDWGIIAGPQYFRDISNLNDTKVQDSNVVERFKRVIRQYEGPFGQTTVFLSRSLWDRELLVVPRERVKVVPMQGRNFQYQEMGRSGDNIKGQFVGEYTVEVHHPAAMARLYTTSVT